MTSGFNNQHDDRLRDTIADILLSGGDYTVPDLTTEARSRLPGADVDDAGVVRESDASLVVARRPSGMVTHLLDLLDGSVLTHRVRSSLDGREDLWLGPGVQPVLDLASHTPIALARGGEARLAREDLDVLVGPAGWLPPVSRWELIGLRFRHRKLEVIRVDESELPAPREQLRMRRFLADHYTRERYWHGHDDSLIARAGDIARAVHHAILEAPDLFASPLPPLDELLHDPLQRSADVDVWREIATCQQIETVSFMLTGMPAALEGELRRRAAQYGMSDSQFIVALLSTLSWRTPFAEDMEPWDNWLPERASRPGLKAVTDTE